MGAVATYMKLLGREIVEWERKANEIDSLIIKHSCVGGAAGLIPVPLVDSGIMLGNQMLMYRNINSVMGISLSKDTMRVLGKFMISQVAGMLSVFGFALLGKGVASLLKCTFIASIAGCAIDCATNAGITYVLGVVYAKVLVKSVNEGNGKPPSIDALKDAMKEEFKNTDEMKRIFKEGKAAMRNTNYKDFKADAKAAEEYAQS